MTYQIELEFHPLYELISSMAVFMEPKSQYDLDKEWFQKMEAQVSPIFKKHIQDEERLFEIGYLLLMIWKCPHKSSLTDFLQWFQTCTVGEMYEVMHPYFGDHPLKDLSSFRDSYSHLLSNWNEVYSIEENQIKALTELTALLRDEAKSADPVDFVEKCTNGIRIFPMEDLRQIILVPSFHTAPLNRIYGLNDTLFVHFPVDQPTDNPIIPPQSFVRKTKALADSKRLRILQFLATEPKTFTEIGKEMKLSKSNLHYHLTLLRTAGLVRITNYKFKQPDLYETRLPGFHALKAEMETYIFDKREKL